MPREDKMPLLIYYHKYKKQLKYYYDNREKRLLYMKDYRKNHKEKIEKPDNKFKIEYGQFVVYFD